AVPTAAPPAGTSGERALRTVRYLAETIGSRPAGSPQERASAGYIAEQLRSYGYTPQTLDFSFPYFVDRGSTVQVVSPQGIQLHPLTLGLSAAGNVDGTIVSAGLGRPEDLPREGLKGRVALIQRGDITYELKVENVAKAGAVAAIIFNNAQGNFQGRLGQIAGIPAVSISLDEGNRLLQSLSGGEVSVRLSVDATSEQRTGRNIMATRQGASPDTVIFGAHYDSVEAGPGANDNASGVAAVLELARLARPGALTQRFIAFSAEELGFYGSSSYVSTLSLQERQQVKAMVSLDMVGVGERMRFGGDQQLVDAGLAIAGGLGIQALRLEGSAAGGSDHTSFTSAGMAAALLTYTVGNDLDPRYHTSEDRIAFVDPANIDKAVQVCQLLVARLAGGR
ncbi:MAG: M28 family peptidase, partial [Dehalococcoidia bacterium]|nr:M28 family peptidase [Dehalococcoidia bacterium]